MKAWLAAALLAALPSVSAARGYSHHPRVKREKEIALPQTPEAIQARIRFIKEQEAASSRAIAENLAFHERFAAMIPAILPNAAETKDAPAIGDYAFTGVSQADGCAHQIAVEAAPIAGHWAAFLGGRWWRVDAAAPRLIVDGRLALRADSIADFLAKTDDLSGLAALVHGRFTCAPRRELSRDRVRP